MPVKNWKIWEKNERKKENHVTENKFILTGSLLIAKKKRRKEKKKQSKRMSQMKKRTEKNREKETKKYVKISEKL